MSYKSCSSFELKDIDLERQRSNTKDKAGTRITYADALDDEEAGPAMDRNRYPSMARSFVRDRRNSVSSIRTTRSNLELTRTITRRRSIDPEATLPIGFRTLSIHVEGTKEKAPLPVGKGKGTSKSQAVELTNLDWHKLSLDELQKRLLTSITGGLSSAVAKTNLARNGPNKPTPVSNKLAQRVFWYIFGGFGSLLITASILTFISWKPLGSPPAEATLALAIVLLAVNAVQAFFNAYQDYSTAKTMSSIGSLLPSDCVIVRDDTNITVKSENLVVGDLVRITMGIKIPADLRLTEASADLRFDRAVLTGEAEPIPGLVDISDENFLETKNIALQGTHCVGGSGYGIVVQTGDKTIFGRISVLSQGKKEGKTTLELEIFRFVRIIVGLALVTSVMVVILWAAWLRRDHPRWITTSLLIVDIVSVCVAFVPEGLPMAVTISLTIIANKMKSSNVLCKSLATVETLGAVNLICSDKTGTLTMNKMFVVKAGIEEKEWTPEEAHDDYITTKTNPEDPVRVLHSVASLCCTATFDAATLNLPLSERKMFGDATDCAVLRFSEIISPIANIRESWSKIFEIPFNSKNKFMLRMMRPISQEAFLDATLSTERRTYSLADYHMTIKGAPDVLMSRCSRVLLPSGEIVDLTEERKQVLQAVQEKWSATGLRVLMFARKIVPDAEITQDLGGPDATAFATYIEQEARQDMICVGLVGIVDPPKEDIPEVVSICRGAGIRFFMVTGDFKLTAAAIARQVGIITRAEVDTLEDLQRDLKVIPNHHFVRSIVLSGPELITLNENQWSQLCQYEEVVFARTTPEQKLRIVKEFQSRDNIVAMTGDGVNDAPSLKAADIGIAMAGGSDVAIEAADMVLLEDFGAIVQAIESGRLVFDNLKKTVLYLLPAGSFSELWPVLTSIVLGIPQSLSSFLMIIICCLTDAANSMTLAFEQPEADLLLRRPRNVKTDRLADWKLLLHAYVFLGIPECLVSFAMAFWWMQRSGGIPFSVFWLSYGDYPAEYSAGQIQHAINVGSSIFFVNLVIMQLFNLLATRTRRLSIFQHPPLFSQRSRNPYLFCGMIFSLLVAFLFNYVPKLQSILGAADVPVEHWFLPVAFGMVLLLLDEGRKWFVRRYPTSFMAQIAW
ncbi:protein of unknown function [Taphrina deformans PYCC 5710]|uniref:Cation-transporting P-type ATPase N-terminal domain-containing protein n=1 Tax=Taphrina deformans (strain PYCC 5710 / ATCC 11124 / CBS 356.35 / IMI 108563 / JCM 9778 / NBRC 8474) TaxID=1097556 RepID=R4XD09_TAPDE|nr:protein of unknown function [Taphrina deformans PYCC 5710]|eukprot:CCG83761.1 protein of unknown function [Taphrina deformans PYCC 5710]